MVVLAVVSLGATVYFMAKKNLPGPDQPVTLVLEKTYDFGTWTPVVTNTVVLGTNSWTEVFRVDMKKDKNAFYRTRQL